MQEGRNSLFSQSVRLALVAVAVLSLSACGNLSNVPGGPGSGNGDGNSELEASLNALGVNTTASDRVDPNKEDLPEDYAPLGASASFGDVGEFSDESGANRTDELLLVGLTGDSRFKLLQLNGVQIDSGGNVAPGEVETMHTLTEAQSPWATDESRHDHYQDVGTTLRAVAAGDIDSDGLEEMVVVFVEDSTSSPTLRIMVVEDLEDSYTSSAEDTFADGSGVLDLEVIAGDFDGDGGAQVAVAVSSADGAELLFLQESSGSFTVDASLTKEYAPSDPDGFVTLELAAGNLDYDNPEELVVVANEFIDPNFGDIGGLATFFVYDDSGSGFGLLENGPVQGQDGGVHSAVVADADLGDVDGDGLDEVVLAGLTRFNMQCADGYPYLVAVLEDGQNSFTPVAAHLSDSPFPNNPCYNPWRFRFVHANALDLDGDGVDEIQANQLIFEDLATVSNLVQIHTIPSTAFLDAGGDAGAYFNSMTFEIESGDVTGDGRQDLITHSQYQENIRVFGKVSIATVGDQGFAQLSQVNYQLFYNGQETPRALLVPVNVDLDSPVLEYSDASYTLVFTEPVLVATLASAPCSDGMGQNVGSCQTSFGRAESQTVSTEVTVSATASVYVGLAAKTNVPFVGDFGYDFKASVGSAASRSSGSSYTVTKSEVFTTGSLEDSVVFTSIPYDTYTYRILSHPDPELLGGTVTVALPREPLLLKVEREFYNEHITDSSTEIGSNVFDHAVGDVSTYPSASRKNELLNRFGGLENGPQSVGQGTGSTGLELDVSDEVSEGKSLAIDYEISVDVTVGPALAGYTVGSGRESSVQITSGESTTYSVTVGDIDAANFTANQYSYGIFTYVQEVEGQEFEVINFWVE